MPGANAKNRVVMMEPGRGPGSLRSRLSGQLSIPVKRFFRDNYPVLLHRPSPPPDNLQRQVQAARLVALRNRTRRSLEGDLPASTLRAILETLTAVPQPTTSAGATAVGPRQARIWWDTGLLAEYDTVREGLKDPQLVLRFYDVTERDASAMEGDHSHFDLTVKWEERGRSVDFWAANRVYVVELGFLDAEGVFVPLARTNAVEIPREARGGVAAISTSRSNLPASPASADALQSDAKAQAWIAGRRDHPERDLTAELAVHMVYRAFLAVGPRALQTLPRLLPRDLELLRREFSQRWRRQNSGEPATGSGLWLARLDSGEARTATLRYPPVLVQKQ